METNIVWKRFCQKVEGRKRSAEQARCGTIKKNIFLLVMKNQPIVPVNKVY